MLRTNKIFHDVSHEQNRLFKNILFSSFFCGLILVCSPLDLFGGVTGKITGTVSNSENHAPIVGATIQLDGTNQGRISDKNGRFVILNVRPGTYDLKISFIGFKTMEIENIPVSVDLSSRVNIQMEPAVLEGEEVIVVAPNPTIEKDLTASRAVVSRAQLDALPLGTIRDALSLQAGVAGSGSNLNIRGGRASEVAYLIDGVYVQDPFLGSFATDLSTDAIEELSLLSGTFNAEYGNALSGVVNIITREGGRNWQARLETRIGSFEHKDSLKTEGEKINWLISGPLLGDDLRLFVARERSRLDSYLPWGFQNEDSYIAKLTYTGLKNIKVNGMYRRSSSSWQTYSHLWSYVPELWYQYESSREHYTLNLSHTIAQNLYYDLRISNYVQSYRKGVWIDANSTWKDSVDYEPYYNYQYNPNAGNGIEFIASGNPPAYTISRSATLDIRGDFVWQINSWNEIKTGIQFKSHDLELLDIFDPQRDHPYIDDYRQNPLEAAAYVQDKIEFPYIVVNLGLRFDQMDGNAVFRSNPLDDNTQTTAKPQRQISPRLGIAHPISDQTKIHFAYGHFFQNPVYAYLYTNTLYDVSVLEPIFGQPNLDAERTVAYEVGLTHQFTDNFEGRFTAYYKDITGLLGTHYFPPYAEDDPTRFVGYTLIVNEDYANSKGFEINLNYDLGNIFSSGLAYTYSISKGSSSAIAEQYPGTTESTRLYFLKFDRTHGLNVYGNLKFGEGTGWKVFNKFPLSSTELGMVMHASSGYPYTPTGRNVGFVDINSLRKPATYSLDILAGRRFSLPGHLYGKIFLEILNLTNAKNVRRVFTSTGDADYTISGDHSEEYMHNPSHYDPPRTFRFGLTLGWK
ncbi:TonB-dependent receptor [bacterium]|nr:TonB-dependent receptor [bacterium]